MVTLEQVKLLETKIAKAITIVDQLTEENTHLTGENTRLKENLEALQKRNDDLEAILQSFKEEQGRIEEGIVSALDRLNHFETTIENSLASGTQGEVQQGTEVPVQEPRYTGQENPGSYSFQPWGGGNSGGVGFTPQETIGNQGQSGETPHYEPGNGEPNLSENGGNGNTGVGDSNETVSSSELDIF